MYKDNLVAALQKAHQAGKCKGRIIVVEDSDNIRGFDGCMKLSCELSSISHKLFNSEPSAEKPHSTDDCKNLTLFWTGYSGTLFWTGGGQKSPPP